MPERSLTENLKLKAQELGFSFCGVTPAVAPAGMERFTQWIDAGYAGCMDYLGSRAEAYAHPEGVLAGARSLLMLTWPYDTIPAKGSANGQGKVSRYAWGEVDYHDVIHRQLKALKQWLLQEEPSARVRGVVDTAPLLEREFAQLAGLGWIGKHTLLINQGAGSYFFLAALLTDISLEADAAWETDHCGSCTACLDACPTDAFVQPYVLDATRCISYLTIELRDQIPKELRQPLDNWLFGCDVCQDVCPWNRHSEPTDFPGFAPRSDSNPVNLITLFQLSEAAFRERFRKTPLWRSRRRGILRNAAIVLGNQRATAAIPVLQEALSDEESLIRGAAAWALGQMKNEAVTQALQQQLITESDAAVRAELTHALSDE